MMKLRFVTILLLVALGSAGARAQKLIPVARGWSGNSVNAVVFRQNALVTHADTQFVAFYTPEGDVALGKRHIKDDHFSIRVTPYKGQVQDAHNCISVMLDGDGYLHVSWDHHNHPLHYARSVAPYSLILTEQMPMTGVNEGQLTYPQFFKKPDGNLIFMFRDGESGKGNLVVNGYDTKKQRWTQLQNRLIDGEGQRNAYWQACIDKLGVIHVSWVWRETWDVASNHDMCYARSTDGGLTWEKSNGEIYSLPITAETAEYAARIPQNSELINQTSMTTDDKGRPVIASYWREQDATVPQYHIISLEQGQWKVRNLAFRESPFSLSGGGTKRIPVSRPQIVAENKHGQSIYHLIFRDEERGGKVSVATVQSSKKVRVKDVGNINVGFWEPVFDTELWKDKKELHLFVQKVEQVDAEGMAEVEPALVYVLEL